MIVRLRDFFRLSRRLTNVQRYTLFHFRQMQQKVVKEPDIRKIRNIGIIAHIDAGKTTTTERMLYYSGYTRSMGEVHDGDTVMDYMPQERERGITITSAAITFYWKKHKINLIDTPGHVDFTIEVERSLCALDGGIIILDSSAGVEVQTLTVWNQAERYHTPCIAFLNKMDKPNADFSMSIESLKNKLKVKPLLLQIPIGTGRNFSGVIDIVSMRKLLWDNTGQNRDGHIVTSEPIHEDDAEVSKSRNHLIEEVADLDDLVAEKLILHGHGAVTTWDLCHAIHRITMKKTALPILCGSAYKNIGIQPLMDAIVLYLPSPDERISTDQKQDFVALVFKIMHHKRKGALTFLRLYSGNLKTGQKVYNVNRKNTEKIANLMIPYADDYQDIPELTCGNIGVVSGLVESVTGDVLISNQGSQETTSQTLSKLFKSSSLFQVPDPVFFCTIEPPSPGAEKALDDALERLQREDPTFQVEHDDELGQIIISGMGELHIEIMKERILKEYNIETYLGPLQVAYRETVKDPTVYTYELEKTLGGTKNYVKIMLKLTPYHKGGKFSKVKVIETRENHLGNIRDDHLKAVNEGVSSALNHGPVLGYPVIDTKVNLLWLEVASRTTSPMITAAASQCVQFMLKRSSMCLLEPVMKMSITSAIGHAGRILSDLSQKRSQILNVETIKDLELISACTPLAELKGYSTTIRALTGGTCNFTMEFETYQLMNQDDRDKAIRAVTGFAP